MSIERASLLAKQGRSFLDREEFKLAEESFVLALAEIEDPVVRNNLAMARFLQHKPQEALDTLVGYNDQSPNPYRKALMAQCLVALGRVEDARSSVARAIRDLDRIFAIKKNDLDNSWREYTVIIMRAVGEIGDHRQLLDLYKRWIKYHVSWENKYLAGIAAFNLKRFRQAASYWIGVSKLPYAHQLQLICVLADLGVVPPFVLEYKVIDSKIFTKVDGEENLGAMVEKSGTLRLALLISVFGEQKSKDMVSGLLDTLVIHGEQWGRSLGQGLLDAAMISEDIKVMAAKALVRAGVFAEGEKVPILQDGVRRYIKISKSEVSWKPGAELIEKYNEALMLRSQGKREQAVELLTELNTRSVIYPPALLVLANLYRDQKMPEKARPLLEALEEIAPDHPVFLFNLAGFWLDAGDREKAKAYVERIDASKVDHEFKRKLDWLRNILEPDLEREFAWVKENGRLEIEKKKLPTEPTMARGLRNMPVLWVRKASAFWQVNCEHRKDGEEGLVEVAKSPARVRRALLSLPGDERELLKYVLDKGGYARVSAITRKFGSMEGDGFLDEKESTSSALGRLWLKCFIFVGKALLNRRNEKIAAIPIEMRDELLNALSDG